MARFESRFPTAGIVCTQGVRNYVASVAAPTGEPLWPDALELSTRSQSIQDLPMLVELLEFTTDGSTGSANNSVAIDPDVTRTAPTGKHTYTGSGAQIPGGTERVLWRREVPPQYPLNRNLIADVPREQLKVLGGRFLVLAITPNTVNQTVFPTIGVNT